MVKGIEHVALFSTDTKKLSDWYVKMFDLKVVYDNGKGTYFVAFSSGDMMELISTELAAPAGNDKCSGICHLALAVDDDQFAPMVEKLKADGVKVVTDVVENNGIKTFFFKDPDGNVAHLIYRPNPLV